MHIVEGREAQPWTLEQALRLTAPGNFR